MYGLQHSAASLALIKVLARVLVHTFTFVMTAPGHTTVDINSTMMAPHRQKRSRTTASRSKFTLLLPAESREH